MPVKSHGILFYYFLILTQGWVFIDFRETKGERERESLPYAPQRDRPQTLLVYWVTLQPYT